MYTHAHTHTTHPAEEAREVGEPARGHLLEDDGEVVRLALLGGRLELHHERRPLGGEGQRPGRDHHRPAIVREGHAPQGRRRVLLLELLEDGAELGRRLRFLLFVSASGGMQGGGGGIKIWFVSKGSGPR